MAAPPFPEVIDLSADYTGVVAVIGADIPRQEAQDHDKAEGNPHRPVAHSEQRRFRTMNCQRARHKWTHCGFASLTIARGVRQLVRIG